MGIQPLGTSSGSILKLLWYPSFCTSSKNIPLPHYIIWYFVLFQTCIYRHGQGETTLGNNIFDGSRKSNHFDHWMHGSRNIFGLWFYAHFFMILYVYSQVGADNPLCQNFDVNIKASSLWLLVASFKKNFSTSDFIHFFFHDLNRNLLSLVICLKFQKKTLWSLILYT